ncbi:hypothetical protein Hdeb2414_s0471g00901081 [Helianthus debilis subsp. tardiflorus]
MLGGESLCRGSPGAFTRSLLEILGYLWRFCENFTSQFTSLSSLFVCILVLLLGLAKFPIKCMYVCFAVYT